MKLSLLCNHRAPGSKPGLALRAPAHKVVADGKGMGMRTAAHYGRLGGAIAVASLVSACVQPAYQMQGPVQLQQYPPAVSYDSSPNYRYPPSSPIPLQAAPLVDPLPPPARAPAVTETVPEDQSGAIPLTDMPPPSSDRNTSTTAETVADPTSPPPQVIRKAPSTTAGTNVPLEGFRPMHSQTRPTP